MRKVATADKAKAAERCCFDAVSTHVLVCDLMAFVPQNGTA